MLKFMIYDGYGVNMCQFIDNVSYTLDFHGGDLMEHILQFGISIDEQTIVDRAVDKASRAIVESVQKEINNYTRGYESKLETLFRKHVNEVIKAHEDEIIEGAINRLTDNLSKRKVVKEALDNMMSEVI